MINGRTKVYGIIGHPVAHSLSPLLHNRAFEARKENAVYLAFDVDPKELPAAVDSIKALGIRGLNITLPHKEQIMFYLDTAAQTVDKAIGAVNTLVIDKGLIMGFNTDQHGFLEDVREALRFEPKNKSVLLLGAGGSARAVAFGLLGAGVSEMTVLNRTIDRGEGFRDYLKSFFPECSITSVSTIADLHGRELDLLVNCTSCGMKKEDPYPVNPEVLDQCAAVYDLIYAPTETRLLQEAARRGKPAVNGLGMLIRQAVMAHRLWFPEAPKADLMALMAAAMKDALVKK